MCVTQYLDALPQQRDAHARRKAMRSGTQQALRTMKAITQHRHGGVDALEYETVARPVAAKDEVLIQVQGASINAADWLLTQAEPFSLRLMFGLLRPSA